MIEMDYENCSPAQKLYENISDIARLNSKKNQLFDCFTTEVIDNIDALTLNNLAYGLNIDINLQDKTHPTPYIKLEFNWGIILILQSINAN
jgi:hypothetical protein